MSQFGKKKRKSAQTIKENSEQKKSNETEIKQDMKEKTVVV